MPRTKGSKNRPKTNTDYASKIAEKQSEITTLTNEIESIQKAIAEQKADAKAAEEAKNAEAEAVLKKLLASGVSADEILEKLK